MQDLHHAFTVPVSPVEAASRAERFFTEAGRAVPMLRAVLERRGTALVVRQGRSLIRVAVGAVPEGACVEVSRQGGAPLESVRRALYATGLAAALSAWALAVFRQEGGPGPLAATSLFFLGVLLLAVVLHLVDRSLERRAAGLLRALEGAVGGDPGALQREVRALDRSGAVATGLLVYFVGVLACLLVFAVLWTVLRAWILEPAALQAMRLSAVLPIVPGAVAALWHASRARRRVPA